MDQNPFPESDPFKAKPEVRATFGEKLPDGSVLELVTLDGHLLLCHSDGTHHVVVPKFDFGNLTLKPPDLQPSLSSALTFPGPPADSASMTSLFDDTAAIFRERGFGSEICNWGALFSLVSWLPEWFASPPTLVAHGGDLPEATLFFTLLTRTCRRAFFSAQLCRSLPFQIRPTLLILAGDMSAKAYRFWRAANETGVYIPSHGGSVETLACARALFMQDDEALASLGPEAWRLALLPNAQLLGVTEHELNEISQALLPRMLAWRLRRMAQVKPSDSANRQKQFGSTGIRQLLMLMQGEEGLAGKIAPLVADQEAEASECRKRDPYRCIVEALWSPSHTEKHMSLEELTKRVNALLAASGELISLGERELGWKCRQLGLDRQRNRDGMYFRFSADMRRTLHQLARRFGLELPNHSGCPYCT